MSWNPYFYILYVIKYLRHCLLYIINLPPRTTNPEAMELPLSQLDPKSLTSSVISDKELTLISNRHPLHPNTRQWRTPRDLEHNTPAEARTYFSIGPEVVLTGPRLKQGLMIKHQNTCLYLREELGRREGYPDQITTVVVDLGTDRTYLIYFPISLFDLENVVEHLPKNTPDQADSNV